MRVLFGACIEGDLYSPKVECQVRAMSKTGARLSITTSRKLPERFELRVYKHEQPFMAEIAWRTDGEIGVRFIPHGQRAQALQKGPANENQASRLAELKSRFTFVQA